MAASDVKHPLTDELFHELAVATWGHLHDDSNLRPLKIPTRSDLESALRDGDLDDAIPEFNDRIGALLNATDLGPGMPVINTGKPLTPLVVPGLDMMNLIDKTPAEILRFFIAANFDAHHDLWYEAKEVNQELKHPIAPFVEEWFKLPAQIKPERKRVGILPSGMRGARVLEYLPGLAPEEAPLGSQGQEAMLPGLTSIEGTIVPTAIVQTWARGGGTELNRGRGAPLSKRIFYEVLTEMSFDARRIPGRKHIILTLRDLRDWLYPREDGKRHNFRPQRDIEKIRDALWEVDQMRIKVIPPGDKAPTNWRVIDVRAFPDPHLDSRVEFYIELPPGSSGGALIDRYAMRRFGLVSAPQHSASLGLAYYWDKYGTYNGRRILATRPRVARNSDGHAVGTDGQVVLDQRQRPVGGFSDDRLIFLNETGRPVQARTLAERRKFAQRERNPAVDRYPVLLTNDLLMLCYPESAADLNSSTSRKSRNLRFKRLERAKDALEQMENDGYCVIEPAAGELGEAGYRVMPTAWAEFSLC